MEKYLKGIKGEVSNEMFRWAERGSSQSSIQRADPVELLRSLRQSVDAKNCNNQLLNQVDDFLQGERRELQTHS